MVNRCDSALWLQPPDFVQHYLFGWVWLAVFSVGAKLVAELASLVPRVCKRPFSSRTVYSSGQYDSPSRRIAGRRRSDGTHIRRGYRMKRRQATPRRLGSVLVKSSAGSLAGLSRTDRSHSDRLPGREATISNGVQSEGALNVVGGTVTPTGMLRSVYLKSDLCLPPGTPPHAAAGPSRPETCSPRRGHSSPRTRPSPARSMRAG